MADLPFVPADAGSTQQLLRVVDAEGKIPRALEAHGPFAGRDVTLFGASPERERWLTEAGARLTVVADPATEAVWPSPASADIVMAFWAAFDAPDRSTQLANAERLLRPDGRLVVVVNAGDASVVVSPQVPELARRRLAPLAVSGPSAGSPVDVADDGTIQLTVPARAAFVLATAG